MISVSLPGNIGTGVEAAIGILIGGAAALGGLLAVATAGSAGFRDRLATSFEAAADTVGRVTSTGAGGAAADAAGGSDVLDLEALRRQLDETRDFLAANAWAPTGRAPAEHLRVALIHDAERIARGGCRGAVYEYSSTADAADAAQSDPLIRFLLLTSRAEIDAVERAVARLSPG